MNQILWFIPEILRLMRQEDCLEYATRLGYMSSRLTKAVQQARPQSKQINKTNRKTQTATYTQNYFWVGSHYLTSLGLTMWTRLALS